MPVCPSVFRFSQTSSASLHQKNLTVDEIWISFCFSVSSFEMIVFPLLLLITLKSINFVVHASSILRTQSHQERSRKIILIIKSQSTSKNKRNSQLLYKRNVSEPNLEPIHPIIESSEKNLRNELHCCTRINHQRE